MDKQNKTEWIEFCSGPNARVWMHVRCKKEMEGLSVKDRSKIAACMMDQYCTVESITQIPDGKLNKNEGRHGADKLLVQAFKNYQGRVYGVEGSYFGKRTFFASTADVKKQDKADPAVLKRAADRAASAKGIDGVKLK